MLHRRRLARAGVRAAATRAIPPSLLPRCFPIAASLRHTSASVGSSGSTPTVLHRKYDCGGTAPFPSLNRGVWQGVPFASLFAAEGDRTPTPPVTKLTSVPRILVSACLMGERVAYHGRPPGPPRRKRSREATPLSLLLDTLWRSWGIVECIPLCPEMQLLQLPCPRPPVRLVEAATWGDARQVVMQQEGMPDPLWSYSRGSHADAHKLLAREILPLTASNTPCHPCGGCRGSPPPRVMDLLDSIDGIVLKARSPSCGLGDARVYTVSEGRATAGQQLRSYRETDGLFAAAVRLRYPALPTTSERHLQSRGDGRLAGSTGPACTSENSLGQFLDEVLCHFEQRNGVM